MSQNEDELLDLLVVAKKQMAIVQAATEAMQEQREELYGAIELLKNMQVNVAGEAKKGIEQSLSGIGTDANAALRREVNQAKTTLGEILDDLRGTAWALSWRWMMGVLLLGLIFGLSFGWIIWGRGISSRLDAIEQTLQQSVDVPSRDAKPVVGAKSGMLKQKKSQSNVLQEKP